MALSQNIGVLNPGDLYTITAKLTQGELSLHADDQIIAKIRYGFGTSIPATTPPAGSHRPCESN